MILRCAATDQIFYDFIEGHIFVEPDIIRWGARNLYLAPSQFLGVFQSTVTGTSFVCITTKANLHSNQISDDSQELHTRWHSAFLGFDLEIVTYLENLIAKIEEE
jgi:hypothetical protein